jgi:NAD(P)-dependent dehydrogenase (short-subunit alcohol dehydrogenase family)
MRPERRKRLARDLKSLVSMKTTQPQSSPLIDLKNTVALVTGAGSGIGRAAALAYARAGASVVVSDLLEVPAAETVRLIEKEGGRAVLALADVARYDDCVRMVRKATDTFGRLDIACNNAGVGGEMASTADYTLEGWQKVINTNLTGVFHCMKAEIPELLKAGGGAIVNVSSILGSVAFANAPAYTASKHGVNGLTQASALEFAAQGIRINAIGPAFIRTPMIEPVMKDAATAQAFTALHPIGRIGEPEEVANLIVWLTSPQASFITGAYYPVDGGFLAR